MTALKKTKEIHPDVPVVVISGSVAENDLSELGNTDGTYFVSKNNLSTVLQNRITQAWNQYVTKWKERESRRVLRYRNERYHTLIESLEDMVVLQLNASGQIQNWSSVAERIEGFRSSEIINQSIESFYTDADVAAGIPQKHLEIASKLPSGRFEETRGIRKRKDGSQFDAHTTIKAIKNEQGKVVGFSFVLRDITLSVKDRDQIVQQAELLDQAQDGILKISLEGKILYCNQGGHKLYDKDGQMITGTSISDLLFQGKFEEYQRILEQVLREGTWVGRLKHDRKVVKSSWSLVQDANHNPVGIILINTDITEQVQLEERHSRAMRMESIGGLAAGIAHDFNNLLTSVVGGLPLIKLLIGKIIHSQKPGVPLTFDDFKKVYGLLDMMEQAGQDAAKLTQQIMGLARDRNDTLVQTRHIITQLTEMYKSTFPKNIVIESNFSRDLWPVVCNPTEIRQVLTNLCVNARDALFPDGGNLNIRSENRVLDEVFISTSGISQQLTPGPYVCTTVQDSGSGIAPDVLPYIFDEFFTTKGEAGNGFGLATVKSICEKYRGSIIVDTKLSVGTTFQIYLPAKPDVNEMKNDAESLELLRGHGERILLVDDQESIRTITSENLMMQGYKVLAARDGTEALTLFVESLQQEEKIHLVLTDMDMPSMDGNQLMTALKRIDHDLEIMIMRGSPSESKTIHHPQDASKILKKPYTLFELLSSIHEVLQVNREKPTTS